MFQRTPEQAMLGAEGELSSARNLLGKQRGMAASRAKQAHNTRMAENTYQRSLIRGDSFNPSYEDMENQSRAQMDADLARADYEGQRALNVQANALRQRYRNAVDDSNDASIRGYAGSAPREQLNAERMMKSDVLTRTLGVLAKLLDPGMSMNQQSSSGQSLLSSLLNPIDTNINFRSMENQPIGGVVGMTRPSSSMYRYG